jgi:hypothetical protein
MALRDTLWDIYRRRDWATLHKALDAASPGRDAEERCCIAYWRAAGLEAKDHCLEANEVWAEARGEFSCKTLVHKRVAENLHRLGRDEEAIEELQRAPMLEEMDRYRALVLDAKYLLAHLMAVNGFEVEQALLDEIPENYIHIDYRGRRISKADLMAMIARTSPCGCGKPA